MKITDVRYLALQYPLTQPLQLAWGPMHHRNFGLVLVDTNGGLTGVGETSVNFPHWAIKERGITITEGLRHLLIGENSLRIEYLWQKMHNALNRLGLSVFWCGDLGKERKFISTRLLWRDNDLDMVGGVVHQLFVADSDQVF